MIVTSWQFDPKRTAVTGRAFDPHPTTVGFDDGFDQIQTQARPRRLAGEPVIDAVEALKDAVMVSGGDADTFIADRQTDSIAVAKHTLDGDGSAVGTVFDGVADEVGQHLTQPVVVAANERKIVRDIDGDGVVIGGGL